MPAIREGLKSSLRPHRDFLARMMSILDDGNCLVRNTICWLHRQTRRRAAFRGVDSKRLRFQVRPSNFQEDLQRDVGWALVIQDQSSEKGKSQRFFFPLEVEGEAQPPRKYPNLPIVFQAAFTYPTDRPRARHDKKDGQ